MTARSAARALRDKGLTLGDIAKEMAAKGMKSKRTGKPYTNNGISFLLRDKGEHKPNSKRKEFEKIMAAAPAGPEQQMVMVMGSPQQLRAMLRERL